MKKLFIFLFVGIFSLNWLYSSDLNNYVLVQINDIEIGSEEGLIGWERAIAGSRAEPLTFTISNKNEIYIPDFVNRRINIYDLNLNYIKTVYEDKNKYLAGSRALSVDKQGNIIGMINNFGLKKVDSKGKEIFVIHRKDLPRQVYQYRNFFILNDGIFTYKENDDIVSIDDKGEILDSEKTLVLLQKLSSPSGVLPVHASGGGNDDQKIFDNLRKDKKHVLIKDQYYSTQFYKHKKYYKQIESRKSISKAVPKNPNQPKAPSGNFYSPPSESKKIKIDINDYSFGFIGYDNEHNSYWGAGKVLDNKKTIHAIIIFNKHGEVLDAFQYGESQGFNYNTTEYPASAAIRAVAPNGDVYFMVSSKEKYSFYKVKRQW